MESVSFKSLSHCACRFPCRQTHRCKHQRKQPHWKENGTCTTFHPLDQGQSPQWQRYSGEGWDIHERYDLPDHSCNMTCFQGVSNNPQKCVPLFRSWSIFGIWFELCWSLDELHLVPALPGNHQRYGQLSRSCNTFLVWSHGQDHAPIHDLCLYLYTCWETRMCMLLVSTCSRLPICPKQNYFHTWICYVQTYLPPPRPERGPRPPFPSTLRAGEGGFSSVPSPGAFASVPSLDIRISWVPFSVRLLQQQTDETSSVLRYPKRVNCWMKLKKAKRGAEPISCEKFRKIFKSTGSNTMDWRSSEFTPNWRCDPFSSVVQVISFNLALARPCPFLSFTPTVMVYDDLPCKLWNCGQQKV